MLGDLYVMDQPPAKLLKALAAMASELHPAFDRMKSIPVGHSKKSCVLASHAVRDFLWKKGIEARLQTVYCATRAHDGDGNEIHSLGVGDHTNIPTLKRDHLTDTRTHWSGHMVVVAEGWLIDPTLYQMQRPQWPDLPGMVALPVETEDDGTRIFGMRPLAGMASVRDDYRMQLAYYEQPNDRWRNSPDLAKERRAPVVKALVQKFGHWRD